MTREREVRDVTARGVRMRVVEAGRGSPVILLHGFLASRIAFDAVVPGLAAKHHVVTPDLPGFGESEKPPPTRFAYGIEPFTEAVVDMIAALGLGRVAIVGHGLGGAIGLTLAADHGELVERLVLVDALVHPLFPDIRSRLALLPGIGGFLFKQVFGRGTFRGFYRDRVVADAATLPWDRLDREYDLLNTPAARESAYAVLQSLVDTRATVARIGRVTTPTLVIWGRLDAVSPPLFGQRLAREMANARLELFDCGHAPHIERPDELVTAINRFLDAP